MQKISTQIQTIVRDRNLVALVDKKTGRTMNVSYTEDGLKWTFSNTGKLIYYTNAMLVNKGNRLEIQSNDGHPLNKSEDYKVVHYIPSDKATTNLQLTEYAMAGKAFRLLYTSYTNAVSTFP